MALLIGLSTAARGQAAVKPFEELAGSWTGTGSITLGNGEKERIRCKARYDVGQNGDSVRQELLCASASYKFEMQNELTHAGGNVTGNWNEISRSASGRINGRISDGRIEAMAETGGFAAVFTMVTRGDQQLVRIESKSQSISDVTISLRRAR